MREEGATDVISCDSGSCRHERREERGERRERGERGERDEDGVDSCRCLS